MGIISEKGTKGGFKIDKIWFPLVYDGYDFGSYFEYTLFGEIRNTITKRSIKQKGNTIVLHIDREPVRINLSKLLGRPIQSKKRKEKPTNLTSESVKEEIQKTVAREVTIAITKEFTKRFPQY